MNQAQKQQKMDYLFGQYWKAITEKPSLGWEARAKYYYKRFLSMGYQE